MSNEVQGEIGFALFEVQIGETPEIAKPLKGFGGANVQELVTRDRDGTYRCVYTTRFAEVVYVLHAFQKKSKSGIATPKADMDLIRARLKLAQSDYDEHFGGGRS